MSATPCPECQRLTDQIGEALSRHLQAVARLQDATTINETPLRAALAAVLREARRSREEAFERYRLHLLNHGDAAATSAGK
jgi:ribosomal 50S subunit-associated protein YjgA (DUF615 family)